MTATGQSVRATRFPNAIINECWVPMSTLLLLKLSDTTVGHYHHLRTHRIFIQGGYAKRRAHMSARVHWCALLSPPFPSLSTKACIWHIKAGFRRDSVPILPSVGQQKGFTKACRARESEQGNENCVVWKHHTFTSRHRYRPTKLIVPKQSNHSLARPFLACFTNPACSAHHVCLSCINMHLGSIDACKKNKTFPASVSPQRGCNISLIRTSPVCITTSKVVPVSCLVLWFLVLFRRKIAPVRDFQVDSDRSDQSRSGVCDPCECMWPSRLYVTLD